MGKSLTGVVSLVIAAGVFAEGFKALGMIDAVVSLASSAGAGAIGMSILFVGITTVVAIIAGSNGASFYPLVEMVPKIAKDMGVDHRAPFVACCRRGDCHCLHAQDESYGIDQTLFGALHRWFGCSSYLCFLALALKRLVANNGKPFTWNTRQ